MRATGEPAASPVFLGDLLRPRALLVGRAARGPALRIAAVPVLRFKAHPLAASWPHAAVDIFEADDVLLVELSKGDLEYPHRLLAYAG